MPLLLLIVRVVMSESIPSVCSQSTSVECLPIGAGAVLCLSGTRPIAELFNYSVGFDGFLNFTLPYRAINLFCLAERRTISYGMMTDSTVSSPLRYTSW